MKNKKIKIALIVAAIVWLGIFATDFVRVNNFEKPVFCVLVNGADDGGSGTYIGLGYTIDIEGNFVVEDEVERGVTKFDMKLFGVMRVAAGIRC